MSERLWAWVQRHPGATVRLGFGPMLGFLTYQSVDSVLDVPWMAVFMVPMLVASVVMVHYMGKFAELNARWDQEREP